MTTHAFADESKRPAYLVAVARMDHADLATGRRTLRALHLAGQRRLHMVKEHPSRQRLILSTISSMPVAVTIYRARPGSAIHERERRGHCLDGVIRDLATRPGARLVLERDETTVRTDRARLYAAARREGCPDLEYVHESAAVEPLLALPDAVAWAWNRGGDWRRRTAPVVDRVSDV